MKNRRKIIKTRAALMTHRRAWMHGDTHGYACGHAPLQWPSGFRPLQHGRAAPLHGRASFASFRWLF